MKVCPKCGASMVKNGTRVASNSVIKQRWFCKGCHHSKLANITPELISGHDPLDSRMSLKEVTRTWLSRKDKGSCQLVVPKELAVKAGIYEPSQVIVEETDAGLLIRRLEL